MLFPVMYQKKPENYIDIDVLISEKEDCAEGYLRDCKGIFVQKPLCWKYEKEWRICHMNKEEYSGKTLLFLTYQKYFWDRA